MHFQIFTVLAHRSTKMKLCDSWKHFIPNLSKPVTAAYSGEKDNTNFEFFGLTYKRKTKCCLMLAANLRKIDTNCIK
jgi:hypothetical protein